MQPSHPAVPAGHSSTESASTSRDNEYGIDDGLLLQLKYKAIGAKGSAYCKLRVVLVLCGWVVL